METTTFTGKDIDRSPVTFALIKKNTNPPGEGKDYPACVIIPTVDEIYEETDKNGKVSGKNRVIRYIPGEMSVYADEQSKEAKYRPEPITITDGVMTVDYREVLLLEFLRKSNYNQSNKHRKNGKFAIYKEYNHKAAAETYLEEQKEDLDIKNLIYSLDPYELEAYALVLGDSNASVKQTSEIRRDLMILANHDPKKFKDGMKNASMKRKVHIIKAVNEGLVVCDNKKNEIRWPDGTIIKQVPISKDATEHLVELSFEPAYKEVYNYLKEKMYPEASPVKTPEEPNRMADTPVEIPLENFLDTTPKAPMPKTDEVLEQERLEEEAQNVSSTVLYERAIALKVLYYPNKSPWLFVADTEKDHVYNRAGLGKKGVIKRMDKESEFKSFIIEQTEAKAKG